MKGKIKMNYTQKERFVDRLCGAGLMLILIEVLYAIVEYAYGSNFNYNNVAMWTYIGGGVLLVCAIVVLVFAYLQKSNNKACYGLELLVMAFTIAMLPGCYVYFPEPISHLKKILPFLFLGYYIGKAIYIIVHRNDIVRNKNKKTR